jgi:hypothetical protein
MWEIVIAIEECKKLKAAGDEVCTALYKLLVSFAIC